MSKQHSRRSGLPARTMKVAVPAVVALGAGGAIAAAAIPSADGTITGCYATGNSDAPGNGALRIVNDESQCQPGETAIAWNQRGPKGEQGIPGVQGNSGAPGAQGGNGAAAIPSGGAGSQIFLKLDGIPGESTSSHYKADIDASTFSFGVTNAVSHGTGMGSGAGKATFSAFVITKAIDMSSPQLLSYAAQGKFIPTATVSLVKPGSKQYEYETYKFSNVLITADHQSGVEESVSFEYSKFVSQYHSQKADGTTSTVTAGYDLKTNKKV